MNVCDRFVINDHIIFFFNMDEMIMLKYDIFKKITKMLDKMKILFGKKIVIL